MDLLITILIGLLVVAIILWLVNAYIPFPQPIKMIVNAIIVLIFCVWLLGITGIWHGFEGARR